MSKQPSSARRLVQLIDLADYHRDAEASLRLYFSPGSPNFAALFTGYRPIDVTTQLTERLSETDMRSALVVMARVEAAFRADYKYRSKNKDADVVSRAFRRIFKQRREMARLDEDIWETWRQNVPSTKPLISQLRSMFKFRHWLAHGRYWQVGNKYDFQTVYELADAVLASFPLYG
jgi:hypothetical protein